MVAPRLRRICTQGLVTFWATRIANAEPPPPQGHLEPCCGWKPGTPIEERADLPEPKELYDEYGMSDGGSGRPVVLRGAAKHMGAMEWTNDDILLDRFGEERVEGVEYDLKETREGGQVPGMKKLKDFLKAYNTSDIYMVSRLSKNIQKEVAFLPSMRCGGFLSYLDVANMWMGRGGSASVIHYDDQDNINCMFAGTKRFVFFHPKYKKRFEAHPNSKKNKFGWVDAALDSSIKGYGGFMGGVNASSMDLVRYPGWLDVDWSYADLQPGDCLYIPYQWYHQVTAGNSRSINIHVWYWRPSKFDEKNCQKLAQRPAPAFADCTWGYEPQGGHFGKKGEGKATKCRRTDATPVSSSEL
eukprot:TRINITY_DN38684_c0_g1_i1.p1 TRINITY_DN38684_c0_g1~~TRINITY_DN38684_c0_g1_i1.p1  ORF type:complete len:356 (-),score=56.60 TRINITY_DN38684_c0_g1_i1:181-1248(-)